MVSYRLSLGAAVAGALSSASLAFLLFTPTAHADREERREEREEHRDKSAGAPDLGFDLDGAAILTQPRPLSGNSLSGGSGFKVRLGDQLRLPLFRFTPEIGYAFVHLFATDDVGASYAWDTHRLFAGARLGFGEILVPTLYGHVGYGWRMTGDPTVREADGMAFDVGLAFDLHIIPHFGFGAHAEYAMIDSTPYTPHWLGLGLQADIAF